MNSSTGRPRTAAKCEHLAGPTGKGEDGTMLRKSILALTVLAGLGGAAYVALEGSTTTVPGVSHGALNALRNLGKASPNHHRADHPPAGVETPSQPPVPWDRLVTL